MWPARWFTHRAVARFPCWCLGSVPSRGSGSSREWNGSIIILLQDESRVVLSTLLLVDEHLGWETARVKYKWRGRAHEAQQHTCAEQRHRVAPSEGVPLTPTARVLLFKASSAIQPTLPPSMTIFHDGAFPPFPFEYNHDGRTAPAPRSCYCTRTQLPDRLQPPPVALDILQAMSSLQKRRRPDASRSTGALQRNR